jgi:transcriptional regulator with XRE-family HTH domain
MSVIGDNIRKNRLKNNLTTRDLAQKIGVSHTAVNKFEKGLLSPNKQMIRKMARIFKVKTQRLVLDTSTLVDIKNIEFRDEEKITKKNKELIEYIAKEELEKYSNLLEFFPKERFLSFTPDKYREEISSYEEIEEKAANIRKKLGAGETAVFSLTELLENNGLIIIFAESVDGFSAQEGYIQEKYLFVTLRKEDTDEKQRYLLANELGRLLLDIKKPDLETEDVNDEFASSFLMSRDMLIRDIGKRRRKISFYELEELRKKYRLPEMIIIKRLRNLKIISEAEKTRLQNYVKDYPVYTSEGEKSKNERSDKYKKIVIEAVLEKYIDYKKGAKFLNMLEKDFLNLIDEKK